ncbi:hypothetical protein ACFOY2_43500 [Nonomuraea purpurea]|uniref:Uncharacterized protein n=1 Tax=Nonomuraea purpurea TaxID=1849276 RepID=A0ABV8GMT3_9ACTN
MIGRILPDRVAGAYLGDFTAATPPSPAELPDLLLTAIVIPREETA